MESETGSMSARHVHRGTPGGYPVGMTQKNSLWPAVALVAVVVAGVVVLSLAHVSLSALVDLVPILVVPLLGVLLGKIQAVQTQTNGNTSKLLEQIDALRRDNARQSELLARSAPVASDDPLSVDYFPPSVRSGE